MVHLLVCQHEAQVPAQQLCELLVEHTTDKETFQIDCPTWEKFSEHISHQQVGHGQSLVDQLLATAEQSTGAEIKEILAKVVQRVQHVYLQWIEQWMRLFLLERTEIEPQRDSLLKNPVWVWCDAQVYRNQEVIFRLLFCQYIGQL